MKRLIVVQILVVMAALVWGGCYCFSFLPEWAYFPMFASLAAGEIGLGCLAALVMDSGEKKGED